MTPERAEAVRTLYLQMRNSAWSAVVVAVYIVGTAAPYTPWRVIALWALAQAAMQAGRLGLIGAWNRRARPDAELQRWARGYTLYQMAMGALWGSTIFLFAHPAQPITVALTMCCLYSLGAGSVPSNAYNPPGLYALIVCMFAPMVVRLLATGIFEYILLGLASGLYGLAMIGMCRVQARALDDGFRIRFENVALVHALRVQTEDAETARRSAERASLAKSQFLAAASHDLRQPLYALSLFSASLEALRLDEDGRGVVARIQDSIGAMEQLFNGLLDLSKLDAGVVQARLAPVSVDALFDRLSQYFLPIARDRGLELRFRSDGEWLTSDATLLEQVLGNLVANAIRYTVRGGVLVAARRRAGAVLLEVWDTGIGMQTGDLQRIFEEFVQLGNAERDRRRGLGLGLSIARRSAALIGAAIDVASRPERGSRFGLAQPACQPALALPAPESAAPESVASASAALRLPVARPDGRPVLIIDDDHDVRTALADLLGRWCVRFDAVADGPAALALIDSGIRYGLVLADYRLAGDANGLDLIGAITARQTGRPPTAILVTADFDPDLIGRARARNVAVMAKPLRPAQLRALLDGVSDTAA